MQPNKLLSAYDRRSARSFSFGEGSHSLTRDLAVEVAVNIVYEPVPYAVMMCTPLDIEDFVFGFSYTEGIIESRDDIRSVVIEDADGGLIARVSLASGSMQRHLMRNRNLSGRTGCGVCGISDLASLPKASISGNSLGSLRLSSVRNAMLSMRASQSLHGRTHAVHAAAWCDVWGTVVSIREDVGRHNALDKLIGGMMRAGVETREGFIGISSRCSFEMVEKAARFGASALVAVSAPTSLAIDRAIEHDLLLLAIARDDGVIAFTHDDRIVDDLLADERADA